jgi:hypothetical protein
MAERITVSTCGLLLLLIAALSPPVWAQSMRASLPSISACPDTQQDVPQRQSSEAKTAIPLRTPSLEVKKVLTGREGPQLSALNMFVRPSCLLEDRVGYFDLKTQRIILAEAGFAERPKLRSMRWRAEHNFKSKSYKLHGDCSGQVWFATLRFIPGTNDLLAIACRQLLLFDATTLELKRSLVDKVELAGALAVASDGSKIAVARQGQVTIIDKSSWGVQAEWSVADPVSGLALSGDGLAATWLTYQPKNCIFHIRAISTREAAEVNRHTHRPCSQFRPVVLLSVPSDANLIAVPFGDSPADFGLQIWDLREARIVREYKLKLTAPTSPFFWEAEYSADLQYAFVAVNSPDYSQDLLILNVDSGQIVYEDEKGSGKLNKCTGPDIADPWPGYQPTLELSEDGRFLIATLGETYEVFELSLK